MVEFLRQTLLLSGRRRSQARQKFQLFAMALGRCIQGGFKFVFLVKKREKKGHGF